MNNTNFKDYSKCLVSSLYCKMGMHPSAPPFLSAVAQDLARFAVKGLLTKTAIDPKDIGYVVMGTVIQEGGAGVNRCFESSLRASAVPAHCSPH